MPIPAIALPIDSNGSSGCNLLDVYYTQNLTIQAGNSGLIVGAPSDPGTIGGTIRFRL
jgi:hypothetical protein